MIVAVCSKKPFSPTDRLQTFCDLGFVVVQVDGMGTSNRSRRNFMMFAGKNLVDSGFPDRVLCTDQSRGRKISGVHRCDARGNLQDFPCHGGPERASRAFSRMAIFTRLCVADCGCHDNRMDKIWWNEQWMGWPVGPEYAEDSNVTLAPKLQGKLLLMVGEADENVDPATTMQVVNALIKADKDFDLLVMPGRGHGVAGTPCTAGGVLRDFSLLCVVCWGRNPKAGGPQWHLFTLTNAPPWHETPRANVFRLAALTGSRFNRNHIIYERSAFCLPLRGNWFRFGPRRHLHRCKHQ